jgi:hypothetical protein
MFARMGDFGFWFGIVIGLITMALGVTLALRRDIVSAKSSNDPRWRVSRRTALVGGIALIVSGALILISRFL